MKLRGKVGRGNANRCDLRRGIGRLRTRAQTTSVLTGENDQRRCGMVGK